MCHERGSLYESNSPAVSASVYGAHVGKVGSNLTCNKFFLLNSPSLFTHLVLKELNKLLYNYFFFTFLLHSLAKHCIALAGKLFVKHF